MVFGFAKVNWAFYFILFSLICGYSPAFLAYLKKERDGVNKRKMDLLITDRGNENRLLRFHVR